MALPKKLFITILVSGRCFEKDEFVLFREFLSSLFSRNFGDVLGSVSSVLHMSDFRRAILRESLLSSAQR
jgi:hypothetical protein